MVQLKYIKRVVLALSNSPVYGGQAQLEGVMFGGKEHTVTAIRRNDDSIDYYHFKKFKSLFYKSSKKFHLYEAL